jgi:Pentapeptide repeats (8 copies)
LVIADTAGGVTVSGPGAPGHDPWIIEERQLRRDEVDNARQAVKAQKLVGFCAVLATAIAAFAAWQAAEAVRASAKGIEQQGRADRLSAAISSIGGDQAAQRVGGFALLRRHVEDRVNTSETPEERLDAYNLYTTALDVLETYLRNPPEASTEAAKEPTSGLGFGRPHIPYDNKYAAGELRSLMRLKPQIEKFWNSFEVKPPRPSVDLFEVQLFQQSWEGIDFAWLGAHYFAGIDLRGANLKDSDWGASWLVGAHLQCANLEGADLRGANLIGADLRGAHLYYADFTGAKLDKVQLDGASFWDTARGLERVRPWPKSGVSRAKDGKGKGKDGIEECLNYPEYSKP